MELEPVKLFAELGLLFEMELEPVKLFAGLERSFETEPEPVKLFAGLGVSFETEPEKLSAGLERSFETERERLELSIGMWGEWLRCLRCSLGEGLSPAGFVTNRLLPPVPVSAHPSYYRRREEHSTELTQLTCRSQVSGANLGNSSTIPLAS